MRKVFVRVALFFLIMGWTAQCVVMPPAPAAPAEISIQPTGNQVSDKPLQQAQFSRPYSPADPLEILLLGDSLAGGAIRDQFAVVVAALPFVELEVLAVTSSSLCNNWFFDWPEAAQRCVQVKLERDRRPYDAVVVLIGANDAQDIVLANGVCLSFGSPQWSMEFTRRCDRLMGILAATTTKVYWLSIPPMQAALFQERISVVNAIYEQVAKAQKTVSYINLARTLGDKQGNYVAAKLVDGTLQVIRCADGVHPEVAGGRLVSRLLVERLDQDFYISNEGTEFYSADSR